MKALVITKPFDYAIQEIPVPEISQDELLIKVKASGICHSDYELISGKYIIPFDYPITPGHEWAGEIVQVGSKVINFQIGDRVTGECVIGCGGCPVCQSGQFTYCPTSDHFGFTINGADAEFLVAKPEWLHKLPEGVDYKSASLVEPFSVGYNAIYGIGGVDAGDCTVILGGGTIGLCTLAVAKAMGSKTILIEPLEYRRKIAEMLGADYTIDPKNEDAIQRVKELTGGWGADLVVEASGHSAALKQSLDLVKNSGRISYIGINIGQEIPVELGKIQIKGITAKGMIGSPFVWERTLAFMAQTKMDLSPISTHVFQLENAVEAFKFAGDPSNQFIKVTLVNES